MVKIIKVLLILIFINFPLGQLTRIPLGISQVNIYLQDILVGLLIISWLIFHFFGKKPFSKTELTLPVAVFVLAAGLSLAVNFSNFDGSEILVAGLYLLRWIFYAGVYFAVSELTTNQYIEAPVIKKGLIYIGTVSAFLGLFQYFIYPDLRNLAYLGWDPHKYRVFGTFLDPGFLGLILVFTIILILGSKNLWTNALGYLLFSLNYAALALTYSRSSYLAYLAGVGVIAWFRKSARLFIVAVLLGVLTVSLLPRPPESEGVRLEREESIRARIKNWGESLIVFKDHPILGVGFDTYRYVQRNYGFISQDNWQKSHSGAGADSSLLFVLATTGILGFAAFAYMSYKAYSNYKKDLVVTATLGAVLVGSWFSNVLFYPWIMLWVWILLGSAASTERN